MTRKYADNIAKIVIYCCLFAMILTGCRFWFEPVPFTYSFCQARENIVKVEICGYNVPKPAGVDRLIPLVEFKDSEIDTVLTEIQAVVCYEVFLADDPRTYGFLLIAITYLDGEIEMIGLGNVGYITPAGEEYLQHYKFHDDIYDVFRKYIDVETYADQKAAEWRATWRS